MKLKRYKVEVRLVSVFTIQTDAYDEEDAAEIVESMGTEDIENSGEYITSSIPEVIYVEKLLGEE